MILFACGSKYKRSEDQTTARSNEIEAPISKALNRLPLDEYESLTYIQKQSADDGWENYYYQVKDVQCVFGDKYFIASKKGPKSENLVVILQGGGACWPGMEEDMCKQEVDEGEIQDMGEYYSERPGMLDWNMIIAPYCDGSLYAGDKAADYDNDGTTDYFHYGRRVASALANLSKEVYPEVEKLVITGCSAGGYGTFAVSLYMRKKYPNAKLYILNESGPGIFNPYDTATWHLVRDTWNLDPIIPKDCEACENQMLFWYEWMLERDPNLKIGLYSSYQDYVIAEEYLKMGQETFQAYLLETTNMIRGPFPDRFNRFFIHGDSHCVEDIEYEINGVTYASWAEMMINDSPGWKDLLE
mgnify:FL=1